MAGEPEKPKVSPTALLIRQRHEENRVSAGWTEERLKRLAGMWNLTHAELSALCNVSPGGLNPEANGALAVLLTMLERHANVMLVGSTPEKPLFPFAEMAQIKTARMQKSAQKAAEQAEQAKARAVRMELDRAEAQAKANEGLRIAHKRRVRQMWEAKQRREKLEARIKEQRKRESPAGIKATRAEANEKRKERIRLKKAAKLQVMPL